MMPYEQIVEINDDEEDIENISNNENEIAQTDSTNSNKILDKIETWNNLTFLTGNAMAAVGNGLLRYNNILPTGPAACFIIDGTVGTLTSLSRLMMYKFDYKNKTLDNVLMWINLLQFPLLDAAVIQLNLPLPLNLEYKSVWGCFIPSASIATLNSSLAITNLCCNSNNDETQPSNLKKVYKTVVNVLPNIGINLALTGVINMSQIYLNQHQDDENKNNAEMAFGFTIAGIGIVSAAVLLNSMKELGKLWLPSFKNNIKNRATLIEEQVDTINNFEDSVDDDATFSQQSLDDNRQLDTESINSEDLIRFQYGDKVCPPCNIL